MAPAMAPRFAAKDSTERLARRYCVAAGAAGADGARFGGLGADAVGLDEALQVGVVGAVEATCLPQAEATTGELSPG